jgi:cob(I)alamin adenosyltransferase
VRLTDDELEKLKTEFPDWEERIERLDSYIEQSGKTYKSHLATIRNWARRDKDEPAKKTGYRRKEPVPDWLCKESDMSKYITALRHKDP